MNHIRRVTLVGLGMAMLAATFAFGQAGGEKTEAQKSFDKLKSFAGTWDAVLSGTGPEFDGKTMHITLRVTSTGNAVMHEMTGLAGRPDNPITMFYVEGNQLMLTHYCDAGNRPRMTGKLSPDGKSVEFEFVDVSGSTQYGHMHHALFTSIDENHHSEEWTFMVGEKPVHAHFELTRAK
jgi:hypothetical protein